MTSGSTTTGIDAQLATGGKITGRVTNSNGTPIANMSVSANPAGGGFGGYGSAITNADGVYTISGLATGTYQVQFSAPMGSDLVSEYFRDTTNYSAATPVTVTADNTTTDIDAQLATGGKITGRVTNSNGTPIANVSVYVNTSVGPGGPYGSAITGADGTYTISGLASGDYRVQFTAPMGSDLVNEYYRDTTNYSAATPVTVTAGRTTSAIDAQLATGGRITGRVTDTNGAPIANASVSASPAGAVSGGFGSAMTGTDGTYTISGLPAGSYQVRFAPMGSDLISEYYRDTTNYSAATPVTVTAGNTTTGIDADLAPGGKITGRVTNSNGTPIANISVSANPAGVGSGGYSSAMTSTDGTYTISGLPAGSYQVHFCADGFRSDQRVLPRHDQLLGSNTRHRDRRQHDHRHRRRAGAGWQDHRAGDQQQRDTDREHQRVGQPGRRRIRRVRQRHDQRRRHLHDLGSGRR